MSTSIYQPDYMREHHEGAMHGTGILAQGSGFLNIHWLDEGLNGRRIDEYHCTPKFRDHLVIRRFYLHQSLFGHSFVVVQTNTGEAFMIHLIADTFAFSKSRLSAEIRSTTWRPGKDVVERSNVSSSGVKAFVENQVSRFGYYKLGFHDCRHFARSVAAFLASRSYRDSRRRRKLEWWDMHPYGQWNPYYYNR